MLPREQRFEVERKVREIRARQKAERASASAASARVQTVASRLRTVDAFRGVGMLGLLLADLALSLQSSTNPFRLSDLFLPWLALGIGIGVPLAWKMHLTRPAPPRAFADHALGTLVAMLIIGTAVDWLSGGHLAVGPGLLASLGIGYYVTTLLVGEMELARAIAAGALLVGYAFLLHVDTSRAVARLGAYHLEWLPLLLPVISAALAGSVAGSELAVEARDPGWIVRGIGGPGAIMVGAGMLLDLFLPFSVRTLSPAWSLVAIGGGLLVFALFALAIESLKLAPLFQPLAWLGRRPLAGLAWYCALAAALEWAPISPGLHVAAHVFLPILFVLGWMGVGASIGERRKK
jgi:hypothetical protein